MCARPKACLAGPLLPRRCGAPHGPRRAMGQAADQEDGSPRGLLLRSPGGAVLELIGTAHVSESDAIYVRCAIEDAQPDAVVIELDPERLPRLGLTLAGLGPQAVVPPAPGKRLESAYESWDPRGWAAAAAAPLIRGLVTRMYDSLTSRGMRAGGEFAAAIKAAQGCGARIVLADVESVSTIEDFLNRIGRSNPLDFMYRYSKVVSEEMGDLADGQELTQELVERLKVEVISKGRFVQRLRDEVPEFYEVFLRARDVRLAGALRAEAELGARKLVAVVGLAHVDGIQRELGWPKE